MSLEDELKLLVKKMDLYAIDDINYIYNNVEQLKNKYNVDRRSIYAKINYYKLIGENFGDC